MLELFNSIQAPVFLVRSRDTDNRKMFEVHTTAREKRGVKEKLLAKLNADGQKSDVAIVVHGHNALMMPRSLESLAGRFGGGEIVYDPTGAFARMDKITSAAKSIRATIGDKVSSIYLEPWSRTLYLVLSAKGWAKGAVLNDAAVQAVNNEVLAVLSSEANSSAVPVKLAVRICFDAPQGIALIPVDARTARESLGAKVGSSIASRFAGLLAAFGLIASSGTALAAKPMSVEMPSQTVDHSVASQNWYGVSKDLFNEGTGDLVAARAADTLKKPVADDVRFVATASYERLARGENVALTNSEGALPTTLRAAVSLAALSKFADDAGGNPGLVLTDISDIMGKNFGRSLRQALAAAPAGSSALQVSQIFFPEYGGNDRGPNPS